MFADGILFSLGAGHPSSSPEYSVWLFVGFGVFVVAMLAVDLGVFHRKAHTVGSRESGVWFAVWVGLALVFAIGVFVWPGSGQGFKFLTAYSVEKALSVDNIFVFLAIFSDFALPTQYRHRALFYGILGALILRAVFVASGVTLINMFHWIVYPLGAFLIFTGIRLARRRHREFRLERNPFVKLARRFLPVTEDYVGQRFFVRRSGVWMITPLFLVVLVIEVNDVAFALDSVPAVLSISNTRSSCTHPTYSRFWGCGHCSSWLPGPCGGWRIWAWVWR